MKKIIYFTVAIAMLSLQSCDDILDPETGLPDALKEKEIIYSYNNVQQLLTAVYTFLPDGFRYIGNEAMLAGASDEAEFTSELNAIQKFNTGNWNAVSNPDPAWANNFRGIYNVNLYLQKVDSIRLDNLKLNPSSTAQEQYQTALERIHRSKYEARFLRAFFYFELAKRYGGVPILTDPLTLESDYTSIPRATLDETVQFIVNECDSAISVLPAIYEEAFLGKATKGAAMALKSRILLYAASDLFNDPSWAGGYDHPEYISLSQTKSREDRWKEAAAAANDVINLVDEKGAVVYGITGLDYTALFRTFQNIELIFAKRYGNSNEFEKINYSIGYDKGNSGLTPLANLVDDYEFLNGTAFDWDNPAHRADPYAKRDLRLTKSILVNNTMFNGGRGENRSRHVELWTGGLDGKGVQKASRTGYYLLKYMDPNLDLLKGQSSVHTWVLFRYGEILLNYAEATNEAYGPTGRVPGAKNTVKQALNFVRGRAGLGVVPPPINTKEGMRDFIRHERRVELAFEDHRLWDVRRWKDDPKYGAKATLGAPARAVEILKTGETATGEPVFEYKPFILEERKWDDRMFFYPIPQKEVKIAKGWVQNPLW
jgi:hypothetical protein